MKEEINPTILRHLGFNQLSVSNEGFVSDKWEKNGFVIYYTIGWQVQAALFKTEAVTNSYITTIDQLCSEFEKVTGKKLIE